MPRTAGRRISAPRGTLNVLTTSAVSRELAHPEGLGEWPVLSVK